MPFTGKPQYPSRPGTCPAWLRIDMNHIVSRAPTVKLGTDCSKEESATKTRAVKERHHERKQAGRKAKVAGREKTSLEIYAEAKNVPISVILVISKACKERTGDNQFRFFTDELDARFDELYPGPGIYTANYIANTVYRGQNGRMIATLVKEGYLCPRVVICGVSMYDISEAQEAFKARANDPRRAKSREAALAAKRIT